MTRTLMLILAGSLATGIGCRDRDGGASAADKKETATAPAKVAPVAVTVVAVDPAANEITVREVAAVPAPPGQPVAIKLPVSPTATGQPLGDTKVGEQVAVTCAVKPTVEPSAGVPVVLADCIEVVKIEPKA